MGRRAPLVALVLSTFAWSTSAMAKTSVAEPSAPPGNQVKLDLTIPAIPAVPITPDNTSYHLARVCGGMKTLKSPTVAGPFSIDDVTKAIEEAKKIAANPVPPPAPDPRIPQVEGQLVTALGHLRGACTTIDGGELDLSESFWTALRTWNQQSTPWKNSLIEALNIVQTARVNIPETSAEVAMLGSGEFQSMVLNGLADFLVTRAKAEAATYLQAHLKENLCSDASSAYVPAFCQAITKLDANVSLNSTGTYLQAAARRDVEMLPLRLLRKHAQASDASSAALLALMLYSEARNGSQPLELIANVDAITCGANGSSVFRPDVANAACQVSRLVRIMRSQALDISKGVDPYRPVALVLSFEAATFPNVSEKHFTAKGAHRVLQGRAKVEALLKQIEALAEEIATPAAAKHIGPAATMTTNTFGAKDKAKLLNQSLSLLIQATHLLACLDESKAPCNEATALDGVQSAVEVGTALYSGDIGAMIVATVDLMAQCNVTVPDSVLMALPLLIEIANAKSSKDVSSALEAASAPVGSYKGKYERNVIGVNAFLGVSGGLEWVSYDHAWQRSGTIGLFAPIGIEASTPLGANFHVGGFLSILDVGALASTRLANETKSSETTKTEVKDQGELSFVQVLSPGLFVTLGAFKSPLTLGVGLSMTPGLRNRLTTSTAPQVVISSENLPAFRAQLFAAFDLTLLPF